MYRRLAQLQIAFENELFRVTGGPVPSGAQSPHQNALLDLKTRLVSPWFWARFQVEYSIFGELRITLHAKEFRSVRSRRLFGVERAIGAFF